ncbi:MAG: ATP-binding cassette domain-containing protein [Pseudomonadota bacterium]
MIRVEGLRAGQGGFVLRAAFDVPQGRRVAVAGPSGAGKSTLLGILGGYTRVFAGKILINGVDVTEAAPDARGIAMLFQDGNLFPHLSVAQNVGLGVRPSLRLSRTEMARVAQALERVGLADLAARKPGALSGGQQSRAALARVLLQSAPVLLLDEPFAALGPALRAEMLALTAEVVAESGATMMMVTHAPGEVAEMVDDLIFVDAGEVAPPAPAGDALANPPPALRAYLGG